MINVFRNEKYLVYFLEDLSILKGLSKCLGIFLKGLSESGWNGQMIFKVLKPRS